MKKAVLLVVCTVVILSQLLISCNFGSGVNNVTETAEKESNISDIEDKEAARKKLIDILTFSASEAGIIEDGISHTVYGNASRNFIIVNENQLLYSISCDGGNEPFLLCKNEKCSHEDLTCTATPMRGKSKMCFTSAGGDKTYYYYTRTIDNTCTVDGFTPSQLLSEDGKEGTTVLFELNVETCERRTVAVAEELADGIIQCYYNGTLYLSVVKSDGDTGSDGFIENYYTYLIDVATGDVTDAQEGAGAVYGAIDGKLFFRRGGELRCGGLDLSDSELVAELGDFDAVVAEDAVYINSYDENVFGGSELYRIDASDYSKKTLIDSDVLSIYAYGSDVYFTKNDPHTYGQYGAVEVASTTGGTLYKYDVATNKVEVVFEDCGGDVEIISSIDEKSVIFSGRYYGGLSNGHQYADTDSCRAFFKYDIEKDEFYVIHG